jgi:hypothetical protein
VTTNFLGGTWGRGRGQGGNERYREVAGVVVAINEIWKIKGRET